MENLLDALSESSLAFIPHWWLLDQPQSQNNVTGQVTGGMGHTKINTGAFIMIIIGVEYCDIVFPIIELGQSVQIFKKNAHTDHMNHRD